MMWSSVDLPQPLRPSRQSSSPSDTVREMPAKATTVPASSAPRPDAPAGAAGCTASDRACDANTFVASASSILPAAARSAGVAAARGCSAVSGAWYIPRCSPHLTPQPPLHRSSDGEGESARDRRGQGTPILRLVDRFSQLLRQPNSSKLVPALSRRLRGPELRLSPGEDGLATEVVQSPEGNSILE